MEEPRNALSSRSRRDADCTALMAMSQYLFLIPLLPLLAFAINLIFGRYIRTNAHWIATPAVFLSFLLSLLVLREINDTGQVMRQNLYTWIQSGDFHIGINLYVDQLTAVMLMVVTAVGFLVHVYSKGYMEGDPGFARFFAYLPFFVFSMLMLVLADNFLLLFFFWEGVGLASYLLIGFWFFRRSASSAAQKAFIVNRIGDLAFGLGSSGSSISSAPWNSGRSLPRCRQPRSPSPPASPSSFSAGRPARARSSRFMSGCPTPWRARHPSRR